MFSITPTRVWAPGRPTDSLDSEGSGLTQPADAVDGFVRTLPAATGHEPGQGASLGRNRTLPSLASRFWLFRWRTRWGLAYCASPWPKGLVSSATHGNQAQCAPWRPW